MTYHVRVYRVAGRWEHDIEAANPREARIKALALPHEPGTEKQADCRLLTMSFNQSGSMTRR